MGSTNAGPVYLSASAIQNGSTYFTQHKVPRNDGTNYADYLLSGIDVRAIAIDGGNRKWIAPTLTECSSSATTTTRR